MLVSIVSASGTPAQRSAALVSDSPSTQSTFSSAAAVVLASVLGGQHSFRFTSGRRFDGITRSFTSFSQAAWESADYAGIHFRSACEDGLALGRRVGHRVANTYLHPDKAVTSRDIAPDGRPVSLRYGRPTRVPESYFS
jgi:hypothetical protein